MRSIAATPLRRLGLALGAATALAAVLVVASLLGSRGGHAPPAAEASARLALAGIPQDGIALGRPDAPVTLVEYADLQCPYCAEWSRRALPTLVSEYVRAGKLRIEFRGLAFLGRDSEIALRTAVAAGRQDRLWDVVEGLYRRQGPENSGWVSERLLDEVGVAAGVDARRLDTDRGADWVTEAMLTSARQAGDAGLSGTPAFELGLTGGSMELVHVRSLGPEGLRPAIDRLLAP